MFAGRLSHGASASHPQRDWGENLCSSMNRPVPLNYLSQVRPRTFTGATPRHSDASSESSFDGHPDHTVRFAPSASGPTRWCNAVASTLRYRSDGSDRCILMSKRMYRHVARARPVRPDCTPHPPSPEPSVKRPCGDGAGASGSTAIVLDCCALPVPS